MVARNARYDVTKGIAIMLMVFAHSGYFERATWFINLFHMSVFFMLAGFFFDDRRLTDLDSLMGFAAKKVMRLWCPYVIWIGVFVLCHNVFLDINIYTDNPILLDYATGRHIHLTERWICADFWRAIVGLPMLRTGSEMGGAFWFLSSLFFALILYAAVFYICNRLFKKHRVSVMVLSGIAFFALIVARWYAPGFIVKVMSRLGGLKTLTAFSLIHFGYLIKMVSEKIDNLRRPLQIVVVIISLIVLLVLDRVGHIALARNEYPCITMLLVCAAAGWYLLDFVAKNISFVGFIGGGGVAFIGHHTMPILILHFLAFKMVSFIGCWWNGLPYPLVAAFPVFFHGTLWSLAYTAVGIGLPLCANHLFWTVVERFHK